MVASLTVPTRDVAHVPSKGLAAIHEPLAAYAEDMQVAERCRRQLEEGRFDLVARRERLDWAKDVHHRMLPDLTKVNTAYSALFEALVMPPRFPVTQAQSLKMLSALFGALSKRKADNADENATALLTACADMFNPLSEAIGEASGLWKPVSKHPLILALTVKQMIATRVFAPAPCELREAMESVRTRLSVLPYYAGKWLEVASNADEILFNRDRPAWLAAYSQFESNVPLAMATMAELDPVDDDAEDETPLRMRALNQLWEVKQDAEVAAEEARLLPPEQPRLAACTKPAAKRTRKPRS